MSFVAAATAIGLEGAAATIASGAMMGGAVKVGTNVLSGQDPFKGVGKSILMGGLTGGIAPGVSETLGISMPAALGITSGGLTALSTGSLSQGLMAGMGAYGLSSLGEGMANTGANSLTNTMVGDWQANLADQGLIPGTNEYGEAASKLAMNAKEAASGMPITDRMSSGFDAAKAAPGTFLKDNWKYLAAAAGPAILAGQNVQSKAPQTVTKPGMIRPYAYDPYGGTYTAYPAYEAAPKKAAGGGLMGMNNGGYNPFNYAGGGDPVMRMASGGIAGYAAGGVSDADILGWFNANPGANDALIAQTMQQAGVSPDQVARATGSDYADVNARYLAATAPAAPVAQPQAQTTTTAAAPATGMSVADLYQQFLGRAPESADVSGYWQNQFGSTIDPNEVAQFKTAAQAELDARNASATTGGLSALANNTTTAGTTTAGTTGLPTADQAAATVETIYRNVLGRDADPNGLEYWKQQIMSGNTDSNAMYAEFVKNAQANKEIGNFGMTLQQAMTPYKGYTSSDANNIADEWARNVLGRELTDADRQTQWYKDATDKAIMTTYGKAQDIYGQFKDYATQQKVDNSAALAEAQRILANKGLTAADVYAQTGKTIEQLVGSPNYGLDLYQASQLKAPGSKFDFNSLAAKRKAATDILLPTGPSTNAPAGTTNPYGNVNNPGDITKNADGTITVTPNIPGRPYGGFSGMSEVKNAYTAGGGSLGYVPYAPKTMDEFNAKYNTMTGGSKQAYDYLTGKSAYNPVPYTPTGQIMKPYWESVGRMPENLKAKKYIFKDGKYELNPAYVPPKYVTDAAAEATKTAMLTNQSTVPTDDPGAGNKWQWNSTASKWEAVPIAADNSNTYEGQTAGGSGDGFAVGGLAAMAGGGMAGQFNLGGYSDGGRLLRGPGDGVSDSIPATIGNKQPARLADGEFVVPARIVSELGNGSTEAGARKLYAMMDRVQAARKGSIGKGKVAKNSRADKYLPA